MVKERKSKLMTALQDAEIRIEFGCKLLELFVIRSMPIRSMLNMGKHEVHHIRAQIVFSTCTTLPIFMMPLDSPELGLQSQGTATFRVVNKF